MISDAHAPLLVNYPIGYPLLIAPLAMFCDQCPWLAQIVSVLLSSLGVYLSGRLAAFLIPGRWSLAPALWLAIHPFMLRYASTALADPAYQTMTLAVLLILAEKSKKKNAVVRPAAGLGALLGVTILLRNIGLAMVMAAVADFLWKRGKRSAVALGLVALAVCGPWFLWVRANNPSMSTYWDFWQSSGLNPSNLIEHALTLAKTYSQQITLLVLLPVAPLDPTLLNRFLWGGLASAAVMAVLIWSLWKRLAGELRALSFYVIFYAAILLIWSRQDIRYLYPLIAPAGLLMFVQLGIWAENSKFKFFRIARAAIVLLLALTAFGAIRQSLEPAAQRPSIPLQTFHWMKNNLPGDSVVASASVSTVYFYAQKKGLEFPRIRESADLLKQLRKNGARFALIEGDLLLFNPPDAPRDITNWTPFAMLAIGQDPSSRLLYRNENENTWIFRLFHPEK